MWQWTTVRAPQVPVLRLTCLCKLPQLSSFFLILDQKRPFWNMHQNTYFIRALAFSRPLAYPKYFPFLVTACLLIDPMSQISIRAELWAQALMMAFFEACVVTPETQATRLCCLLERAEQIALYKCLFSVVLNLIPEGSCFLSKALVWGLQARCCKSDPLVEFETRRSSCCYQMEVVHDRNLIYFWMLKVYHTSQWEPWFTRD